jgi:hypothetical protein
LSGRITHRVVLQSGWYRGSLRLSSLLWTKGGFVLRGQKSDVRNQVEVPAIIGSFTTESLIGISDF